MSDSRTITGNVFRGALCFDSATAFMQALVPFEGKRVEVTVREETVMPHVHARDCDCACPLHPNECCCKCQCVVHPQAEPAVAEPETQLTPRGEEAYARGNFRRGAEWMRERAVKIVCAVCSSGLSVGGGLHSWMCRAIRALPTVSPSLAARARRRSTAPQGPRVTPEERVDALLSPLQRGEILEAMRAAIRETWQAAAEWSEKQAHALRKQAYQERPVNDVLLGRARIHEESAAHFRAKAEASRG